MISTNIQHPTSNIQHPPGHSRPLYWMLDVGCLLIGIPMTNRDLELKSIKYRRALLRHIFRAGAGHTGGSLSCVDILNVLYNRILHVSPQTFDDPNRDRYIQSKGHSVEALYTVLADRGFFPDSDLETLCRYQSPL